MTPMIWPISCDDFSILEMAFDVWRTTVSLSSATCLAVLATLVAAIAFAAV